MTDFPGAGHIGLRVAVAHNMEGQAPFAILFDINQYFPC